MHLFGSYPEQAKDHIASSSDNMSRASSIYQGTRDNASESEWEYVSDSSAGVSRQGSSSWKSTAALLRRAHDDGQVSTISLHGEMTGIFSLFRIVENDSNWKICISLLLSIIIVVMVLCFM